MDTLDRIEGVPLYVKIREALREEISRGALKRGDRLPSEDDLAARYGVSRMTVRQGITDLTDEGLLYRRHGVGTFVAHLQLERDHSRLTNFFENSKMDGIQVSEQLLLLDVVPARLHVARALNLQEGEQVIYIKTLRYTGEAPVTIHEAYIPHKLFHSLLEMHLSGEPPDLWSFYERCGYRVKRAIQKLEARQADEECAALLKIEEGFPVLYKERTLFGDDGTPVEFLYCFNRGDMYSLTVTLFR